MAVFARSSQKGCHTVAGVSYDIDINSIPLETFEPGSSNGGSNLQIRHCGADLVASEVEIQNLESWPLG